MGASELETVVRLGLPMLVVVYNDAAYGAEVHHFGPHGHDLRTVVFPDTDLAAMARESGSRRSPCAPWPTSTWSVTGSPDAASARSSSTPRWSPTTRHGGSERIDALERQPHLDSILT